MNLKEWAEQYLRHRDLFERRIEKIEVEKNIILTLKDGTKQECFPVEVLDQDLLKSLKKGSIIVTKNTKENFSFLVEQWEVFSGKEGVKLIFVNLAKNEKWVIIPSNHHRIAEPESLELGLKAMFTQVPEG